MQAIAFTAIIALTAGCATDYRNASATSSTFEDGAVSIDDTILKLDAVLIALDDLLESPARNISSQFQEYSRAVSELEESVKTFDSSTRTLETQGNQYFQNWETEISKIQNQDIQSRSRERKENTARQFRAVSNEFLQTRNDLAPFVSGLVDIRTALRIDLTESGISSLDGLLQDANKDGEYLRRSMVRLSDDFRTMKGSLSAARPVSSR